MTTLTSAPASSASEVHHALAASHHVTAAHHCQRASHFLALGAPEEARAEADLAYDYSELAHYHTASARELGAHTTLTTTVRTDRLAKIAR